MQVVNVGEAVTEEMPNTKRFLAVGLGRVGCGGRVCGGGVRERNFALSEVGGE